MTQWLLRAIVSSTSSHACASDHPQTDNHSFKSRSFEGRQSHLAPSNSQLRSMHGTNGGLPIVQTEVGSFDFGVLLYRATLEEIVIARQNVIGNVHELGSEAPSDSPVQSPIAAATPTITPAHNAPPYSKACPINIPTTMATPPISPPPPFVPPARQTSTISAEKAWRRDKERKRRIRKKQQLHTSSSQGILAANPRLVQRCLTAALTSPLPSRDFLASKMPHAATGYLGLPQKIEFRDFGLQELVGEGSKYGFELRRCVGR